MKLHEKLGAVDEMLRLRGAIQLVSRAYPDPSALTIGRLSKILYLADWYAAQDTGLNVTGLRWLFDERGPTADELRNVLTDNSRFVVKSVMGPYGSVMRAIEAVDAFDIVAVPCIVWGALGKAIKLAATAPWPVFLATVLETPPLRTAEYGQYVDPAADIAGAA